VDLYSSHWDCLRPHQATYWLEQSLVLSYFGGADPLRAGSCIGFKNRELPQKNYLLDIKALPLRLVLEIVGSDRTSTPREKKRPCSRIFCGTPSSSTASSPV
jgi:hypothetical protein